MCSRADFEKKRMDPTYKLVGMMVLRDGRATAEELSEKLGTHIGNVHRAIRSLARDPNMGFVAEGTTQALSVAEDSPFIEAYAMGHSKEPDMKDKAIEELSLLCTSRWAKIRHLEKKIAELDADTDELQELVDARRAENENLVSEIAKFRGLAISPKKKGKAQIKKGPRKMDQEKNKKRMSK